MKKFLLFLIFLTGCRPSNLIPSLQIQEESIEYIQEPVIPNIELLDTINEGLASGPVFIEIRFLRTMLLEPNGDLWAWGDNISGALGDGSLIDRFSPVKIMENVYHISASNSHSIAITKDNRLYTWGTNRVGQLGIGLDIARVNEPIFVMDNIRHALAIDEFTVAITNDDILFAWGYNVHGQLGDGTTTNRNKPIKILENVRSVNAYRLTNPNNGNFGHGTFAITNDNILYAWGFNEYGHLGLSHYENIYSPVILKHNVLDFFPVQEDTVVTNVLRALTTDYRLYSWGFNNFGQIGDGTNNNSNTPIFIMDNVRFAEGRGAITRDNHLYTWGRNDFGQLGDGTFYHRNYPEKIMENVVELNNRGAITEDKTFWVWGNNNIGQLGDTTTVNRNIPIPFMENIHYIGTGFNRTFAVTKDGSLWVWGNGPLGQLGIGYAGFLDSPRKIYLR
ncbi:MAG: hypothetical protein FWF57_07600 [Defluviitaleaceae bacterium]|nr:hypothetical protein [Defluviitaleaceae bacterium]